MNCSYSMNGVDWVSFPRGPQYGGEPGSIIRKDLELVTGGGVRWIYRLYERDFAQLTFLFPADEMESFAAFDAMVDGSAIPFYFSLDPDTSPVTAIYGRKEPDFRPVLSRQPTEDVLYEYTLTITGEIDPDTIEE